ncbi:hypothetical protein ACFL50_01395 [Candidatus Latescibacterota bacterium]
MFKNKKTIVTIACIITAAAILIVLFIIKNDKSIEYNRIVEGEKIVFTVRKGEFWSSRTEGGLFRKNSNAPQMAFWLEDMNGRFLATLYVTKQTAVQDWPDTSYRQGHENTEKEAALPIWIYKHIRAGLHPIETCSLCHDRVKSADKSIESISLLNTLTGATPKGSFIREIKIPEGLKPGRYIVCAEINNAIDYNDRFQENLPQQFNRYNGISGQPSLLLSGFITTGGQETVTVLNIAGHGHPAGKDGMIYSDMSGITTASDIVLSVEVSYIP